MHDGFVHLHVHSNFSFLDGGSSVAQLVQRAAALKMPALALTDHDNVAAAVEFHRLATAAGIQPIQGAELTVAPVAALPGRGGKKGGGLKFHLTVLAQNQAGYTNLCRLLTQAHTENPRGSPVVSAASLQKHGAGLIVLSGCRQGEVPWRLLRGDKKGAWQAAAFFKDLFGDNFYLELQGDNLPGTTGLARQLHRLGRHLQIPLAATNNVHYAVKEQFPIHDLLTCVRLGINLEQTHRQRRLNAENYLKSANSMAASVAQLPGGRQAMGNTLDIAAKCEPVLRPGGNLHPAFPLPAKVQPAQKLRQIVRQGARSRYGAISSALWRRLEHELKIINSLGYADYFLLVWDVVRYARSRGIRCAGRGSAADSAVAYCLYITEVDAYSRELLFERFMSLERAQRPDIDIDFDWRYRDQVAAYIYKKYGKEHVATVGTYHTYRARSALRDLGKAMGFPLAEIDRLARVVPRGFADDLMRASQVVPELRDSGLPLHRYRRLFHLCGQVAGFPRHMGTHLGGLVISRLPLTQITPLQLSAKGTVITQLDKTGVEDLGLVKLDLLPLRTFAAIEDARQSITARRPEFDYDNLPLDDADTFAMINRGETVGVFQLESPAQRSLQPRLQAKNLDDIIASVAIIRPGPIKGNMVEPFLARRRGEEPVTYLHPALEPILAKTWGVVLFQEQVIEIATAVAGFSPGEADQLRRVMSHARSRQEMEAIGQRFITKAKARGVTGEVAQAIFSYIQGYASYGFSEAHAAAFGSTAYKTAYLLRHYPLEFFTALLNQQPMGYYPPNTLAVEARRRGVGLLPLDINRSQGPFHIEGKAIRIGLQQVKGMPQNMLAAILSQRQQGGDYKGLADFYSRLHATGTLDRLIGQRLILAGAFDALNPHRRQLLWKLDSLHRLGKLPSRLDTKGRLPDFSAGQRLKHEFDVLSLNVHRGHTLEHWRPRLRKKGFADSRVMEHLDQGVQVKLAGVPVHPHRPPTRSGRTIVFFSLEDEFGLTEVTVFEAVYQRYGRLLFGPDQGPLIVQGQVDRQRGQPTILARHLEPLAHLL